MSKLTCRCGTVLSDYGDAQKEYRGELLAEAVQEQWYADELRQIKALITAMKAGQSLAEFIAPGSSAEVAEALLTWKVSGEVFFELSRQVFQCPTCGRLLVETASHNEFRTFFPESDDAQGILKA